MGFDFTIAITPSVTNLDKELQYIKAALLYADKITLISPLAYMFTQLSSGGVLSDERRIIRIMEMILPMFNEQDPATAKQLSSALNQYKAVVQSKQYKGLSMRQKIEIRIEVSKIAKLIDEKLYDLVGQGQLHELESLLKTDKLNLQRFEHNLSDAEGCTIEYFKMLRGSIKDSYPLFDELSNTLMVSALNLNYSS